MRRRSGAWLLALALATTTSALATTAAAEAPAAADLAQAREQFRRGLALEQAGDWEGALELFKGVALVKSTSQVRFHIALCQENVGHWVEALGSYRLALSEGRAARAAEVERESLAAIAALEPRIPRLSIVRGSGATAATILLDGRELGPTSIGRPIAVDPGPHRLEARSPGRPPVVREIEVAAGSKVEVALAFEPLGSPAGQRRAPEVEASSTPSGGGALVPVAIGALGVGALALGASGVFFALRQDAIAELDGACGADRQACPGALRETADRGATWSTLSTATFVGGLGLAGLGATLLVVDVASAPDAGRETAAARPTRLGLGPGGVALTGAF